MVTETDIANRALQRVGTVRIAAGALRTENSKNAEEIRACYDILRRAELRRNVWVFSIRVEALRPIGDNSKLVTFGTWSSGTAYAINDIVTGSDGNVYVSTAANNTAHDPTAQTFGYWQLYFGSLIAQEYVTTWSSTITYAENDHAVGSDGSVYISLADSNLNHDPTSDGGVHWAVTTDGVAADSDDYYAGEVVYTGNQVYISKVSANATDPGSSSWLVMSTAASVASLNFVYPLGSGPFTNNQTKNVYRLPNGYVRLAPQAPKAGSNSFLGAPGGLRYADWDFQDQYFITDQSGVILFRFACDLADPNKFDPMFIEGFSARIALEVCESLTQSDTKLQAMTAEYMKFMSEARTVNGIETGPTQPPEDDYVATRY